MKNINKKMSMMILSSMIVLSCGLAHAGPQHWKVKGSGNQIIEGKSYALLNLNQGAYLRHEKGRWHGPDLSWNGTQSQRRLKIVKQSKDSRPLKCGETFALSIGGKWVAHNHQSRGINLSAYNKYSGSRNQWKFVNCGSRNSNVVPNKNLVLYNVKAGESIVGCKRAWGVNLCWKSDAYKFKGKYYRKADLKKLIQLGRAPETILDHL